MSSRVTFSSPRSNASSKAASLSAQRVPSFLRSRSPSVAVTNTKVDESCTAGNIAWYAISRDGSIALADKGALRTSAGAGARRTVGASELGQLHLDSPRHRQRLRYAALSCPSSVCPNKSDIAEYSLFSATMKHRVTMTMTTVTCVVACRDARRGDRTRRPRAHSRQYMQRFRRQQWVHGRCASVHATGRVLLCPAGDSSRCMDAP